MAQAPQKRLEAHPQPVESTGADRNVYARPRLGSPTERHAFAGLASLSKPCAACDPASARGLPASDIEGLRSAVDRALDRQQLRQPHRRLAPAAEEGLVDASGRAAARRYINRSARISLSDRARAPSEAPKASQRSLWCGTVLDSVAVPVSAPMSFLPGPAGLAPISGEDRVPCRQRHRPRHARRNAGSAPLIEATPSSIAARRALRPPAGPTAPPRPPWACAAVELPDAIDARTTPETTGCDPIRRAGARCNANRPETYQRAYGSRIVEPICGLSIRASERRGARGEAVFLSH